MILLAVTLISLTIAVAMSVLAWRLMRAERRRSEARIAALAGDIADDDRTVAIGDPGRTAVTEFPLREEPSAAVRLGPSAPLAAGMFAVPRSSSSGFRLAGVVAAGALVVATAIGALVMTSGRDAAPAPAAREAARPEPAATGATEVSLELVALGHEREADRLTVRGVVRNASATAEVSRLTAVVLLFNRDGGFVASGRADVEGAAVAPGAERAFVVTIPAGGEIARYRVSFRSDEHIVPHVDKRSPKSEV